jgi:vacuolar protein sorting-associated protein 41
MDSIIAGLLPYPPNILVLSYTSISTPSTPSSSEVDFHRRTATRPELRIISPDQEELSSDALSLKDFIRLQPGDYSLHWNEKRKCVYIVSPSDIVVGRERTAEDRVQWLLDRGKYREALEVFETSTSKDQAVGKWNRKEIGLKYIEHLIEEGISSQFYADLGQWEEAADRMPTIFALDATLWERNIFLFAEKGHLKVELVLLHTNFSISHPMFQRRI